MKWKKTSTKQGDGWLTTYRGTSLRLTRSHSEYIVWCGQKVLITAKTRKQIDSDLADLLKEVDAGRKVLGQ